MKVLPFHTENRRGDAVYGDIRFVETDTLQPVVVMCHGFKGFKDWGIFPVWGRQLAEAGFVSVLFNFSYNGVSPAHPTTFTQLDRFADNTFTRELDDLNAMVTAVADGHLPEVPVDTARIGLLGHSRGGGTAILHTASDNRIRALVTWNAIADFIARFTRKQMENWKQQGYTEVLNTRTKQIMRLNRVLYDDALAHPKRLDICAAAAHITVPWLLMHARDDEAVSLEEAHTLLNAAHSATLAEVEGGHVFGGKHPFDGVLPATLQIAFDRTLAFFQEAL